MTLQGRPNLCSTFVGSHACFAFAAAVASCFIFRVATQRSFGCAGVAIQIG